MKISFNQKIALAAGVAIVAVLFIGFTGKSDSPAPSLQKTQSTGTTVAGDLPSAKETNAVPPQPAVAPFIVEDTQDDSPGTNIVTRIVTFSAQIGGTPPPALQWKVDKGNGFEVIGGATKATFRIGNAQVSDNGLYSLFATNSSGGLHTTPQQLIVIYGED